MASQKLSPYQRIVRAAETGVGVRLSAGECWALRLDDAIATVAARDDEDMKAGRELGADREEG